MEKKTQQSVSASVREAYNRALKSGNRELDFAISLALVPVKMDPGFVKARERLRELELRKTVQLGGFARGFRQLVGFILSLCLGGKAASDPVAVMSACETQLAKCLDNPPILKLLARAAVEENAAFIAVDALKILNELHPGNESNLKLLVRAMQRNSQARDAAKLFQDIARKHPTNVALQSELRAAMALASLEQGQWDKEASSQDRAVNKEQNVAEQIAEGTIHDAGQAHTMIDKYLKDLEEKESIDTRRKLADAYFVAQMFDESIAELEKVAAELGALDPLVDKNIEKAVAARFDKVIEQLRANPAAYDRPEEQIAALEKQCADYRRERAEARVLAYPNDSQLQFELADLCLASGAFDLAIGHYQQARKSPRLATAAAVALGRCFAAKGQLDMAVEQFELALKDMVEMDRAHLQALYDYARILEDAGRTDDAIARYKEIYQAKSDFRDVGARIDKFYKKG